MQQNAATRGLTSTDVRWLARGYWDHYFDWRLHPRIKPWAMSATVLVVAALLVALVSSIAGTPLAIAASSSAPGSVTSGNTGFTTAGTLFLWLLTLSALSAMVYMFLFTRAKTHYLDQCVGKWESGTRELPDEKSILDHLGKR